MSATMNVPCILIDNENFAKWWPKIAECLSQSDFIAIDLEFSGLGSRDVFTTQIDERFKAIREVASTRTILSMGIACFAINPDKGFFKRCSQKSKTLDEQQQFLLQQIHDSLEDDDQISKSMDNDQQQQPTNIGEEGDNDEKNDNDFYSTVNVFNFLTLNMQEFVMESRSMKFLAQQGFDFNELSLKGIPFYPGNDCPSSSTPPVPSLRRLINLIISLKLPVLFHNGLVDLAFLYHNFYAEIPKTLETFLADLFEMFPNGIFDTKYIANVYLPCSYLEYLFQYSQRCNYFRKLKKSSNLVLEFTKYDEKFSCDVRIFDLSPKIMRLSLDVKKICEHYAKSGWCEKSDRCENSHNIDLILDEELKLKKDKKSKELVKFLEKFLDDDLMNESSDDEKNHHDSCMNNETGDDSSNGLVVEHENGALSSSSLPSSIKEPTPSQKSGCHHAGNDAFMTGYYFLFNHIIHWKQHQCTFKEFRSFKDIQHKFKNKVFLTGKPRPLNIMKSSYGSCSAKHQAKLNKIKEKSDWT